MVVSREVRFNENECFDFSEPVSYLRIDELISDMTSAANEPRSGEPVDKSGLADLNVLFDDDFESAGDVSADTRVDISSFDEAFGTLPEDRGSSPDQSGPSTSTPVVLPISDAAESRYDLRSRKNNREASIAEALAVTMDEPCSYREAISSPNAERWKRAMDEEYNSLIKNHTWEIVKLPPGCKPISCKWVFKIKGRNGKIDRFKACLVARGYTQKYGID